MEVEEPEQSATPLTAEETGRQSTTAAVAVVEDEEPSASPALSLSVKKSVQRQARKRWVNFYAVPIQRVIQHSEHQDNYLEEEEEEEEKEEWEYMFMDLFYVPAISNLSEQFTDNLVYKEDDGTCCKFKGSVLFFASFFAVWSTWYGHCLWESRFISRDDFHHGMNRIRMIFVAIAIFHVRNRDEMMSFENDASFYFCLGITIECAIITLAKVELALRGGSDLVRKEGAIMLASLFLPRLGFYVAAWFLQKTSEVWPWLVLCGSILPVGLYATVQHFIHESMVPMDPGAYFKRIDTWVTIVLGEGVISLVNPNTKDTSAKWQGVILSLITLMIIHSIYFYNGGHLKLPAKFRGLLQATLIQLLSLSLIGIGVFNKEGIINQQELEELGEQTMTEAAEWKNDTHFVKSCTGVVHWPDGTQFEVEPELGEAKYPVLNQSLVNKAYLMCLPMLLFSLEGLFWSSNYNFLKKLKDGTPRTKALIVAVVAFQLAVLIALGVTGAKWSALYYLQTTYVIWIGFVVAVAFYLIRVLFVGFLGKEEE